MLVCMINCVFEDGDKANLRHAVADAVVIKDGKILMVKRSAKLIADPGKWALPGGFMSRDESVIECVEREVYEETGWKVKGTTLFSITDRPEDPGSDRQNICFTYFCEATEKTGKPDWETEELQWLSLIHI